MMTTTMTTIFCSYQATTQMEDEVLSVVMEEYRAFQRIPKIEVTHRPPRWFRLCSGNFPTVAFLAWHSFPILSSRRSIERVFQLRDTSQAIEESTDYRKSREPVSVKLQ